MAASTKSVLQKTYIVRQSLDNPYRHMVYNESVMDSLTKTFHFKTADVKMLQFANDEVGAVSDCFIMYAIGHMGAAEEKGICLFLNAMSRKYPALNIIDYSAPDASAVLHNRLLILTKYGFLFKNSYKVLQDDVSLYSLTEDSFHLIRQKLSKSYAINSWFPAKCFHELVGWAAGAYVGAQIAQDTAFEDYLERVLRTKQLGSVFLPSELKMSAKHGMYYVGVISAYLYHDTRIMTEAGYREYCVSKLNTIKNYLLARTKKATAIVVVAVADNEDLNAMVNLIQRSEVFTDLVDRIYFTGEGVVLNKSCELKDSFLQLVPDNSSDSGYDLLSTVPVFLNK